MTIKDSVLSSAGVPYVYWRKEFEPGDVSTEVREKLDKIDPAPLYRDGTNLLLMSYDPAMRMKTSAVLAQRFMAQGNPLFRSGESLHKRAPENLSYFRGEVYTQPYTVQMMNVDRLMDLFWEVGDRDVEGDFTSAVLKPDFFFVTELGAEWVSRMTAQVVERLLADRMVEELPTVVTTKGGLKDKTDKSGEYVYKDIAAMLSKWTKVVPK